MSYCHTQQLMPSSALLPCRGIHHPPRQTIKRPALQGHHQQQTPSSCVNQRPSPVGYASSPAQQRLSVAAQQQPSSRPLLASGAAATAAGEIASTSSSNSDPVLIVGGGIAGLSCAVALHQAGIPFTLLEASDAVGGRVRTDVVDGFLLDRGFQIFLTSYPEAKAALDYDALDLQPFYAGALVWYDGTFHRVADPLRHFADGLLSLPNPVGSIPDKVNVGLFRVKSLMGSLEDLLRAPETTTLKRLQAEGFSPAMIDRFFRPFLGGIFFDRGLTTSSRLFSFVMRMLATGANTLPAQGIGAVSEQLAAKLPKRSVRTGTPVRSVTRGSPVTVTLADGSTMQSRRGVVVATEAPAARRLLGGALDESPSKAEAGVGTCNLYFRASAAPRDENILYLNGEDKGIVNNACFPSAVAPSYAPKGQALVSVSTIGTLDNLSDSQLESQVKQELGAWFGQPAVASWQLLRIYRIPFAQPSQAPPTNLQRPVQLGNGLYVCGDHRDSATLDGALKSGRRAAEAVLAALRV